MKKYIFFAAAALALASCSNDEPAVNTGNGELKVTANLSSSRMSRANGANWEADAIGVMVTGSTSGMDAMYRNAKYTTASTGTTADFAPEGNGIFFQDANETVSFAAYAPYQTSSADNALPGDAADGVIAASTAAQNTRELQKAFDFIYASGATASRASSTVNFAFSHVMTKLTIVVKPGRDITLDDIKSGNFTLSGLKLDGSFDVTTGVAAASGETTPDWSLNNNAIKSEGTEGVAFTAILFPQVLESALGFKAAVDGQNYANNTLRPELTPGNSYTYNITVNKTGLTVSGCTVTDWDETPAVDTDAEMTIIYGTEVAPDEAAVGDYLLSNGKVIRSGTLTDEGKAIVSAIIFWTPAMTDPEGRVTPASLTDDKIMAADFPNCTHGLAVSVKTATYNGSTQMVWQPSELYEFVNDWQSGEFFQHPRKNDFVAIASTNEATDNDNRIYGYQNTIVLRAYNAFCEANGKLDNIVRPIVAIDELNKTNPAPSGSTGWFLPSAKELLMVFAKDTDDAYNINSRENYNKISPAFIEAGGDRLWVSYHWSSTECIFPSGYAGYNAFSVANVYNRTGKNNTFYVRGVCAF